MYSFLTNQGELEAQVTEELTMDPEKKIGGGYNTTIMIDIQGDNR